MLPEMLTVTWFPMLLLPALNGVLTSVLNMVFVYFGS